MKKNLRKSDEKEFLEAVYELEKEELAELEKIAREAEKEPHRFSEEFEAWKETMLKDMEEKEKACALPEKSSFLFHLINTPMKKLAVAAAFVFVLMLGLGGYSEAGRFPIVKFFQERYESYIGIEPHEDLQEDEQKPQSIETVYELGWLPEGYEEKEAYRQENSSIKIYSNGKKKEQIVLEQYCVYVYFSIEESKDEYEEIKYKGNKYYYLSSKDKNSIVWYREGYQFVIYANTTKEEMLRMADNLKK